MKNCYCCSDKTFENCCEPFISGNKNPETCEQLMRSRYTAYAIQKADYLLATTHISERKNYSKSEILDWSTSNYWQKLEIISSLENVVAFKAYYEDENGIENIHHEISNFILNDGLWYYVNGVIV